MKTLIIGSGLSGAIFAREFAKLNHEVLILEKRPNIAGNIYDTKKDGVTVQMYGPHIFHTDIEEAVEYMNEFWELNNYENKVLGNIDNKIVPIPFNFKGIDTFFPDNAEEIKTKLIKQYGEGKRMPIFELLENKDKQIKEVAEFVYKNVFENYTTKMWGISPKEIDSSVIKRVPIVCGYGDKYFSNKYEGIPKDGFTAAVAKILDHKNIVVETNVDALERIELKAGKIFFDGTEFKGHVIYTGAIDELFKYKYGVLNYRSLDIKFETHKKEDYQIGAVINYPADPTMTRISEYKKFTFEKSKNTVISKEYPGKYDKDSERFSTPYYPMMTPEARKSYEQYNEETKSFKQLTLAGRLATYKYLDMDKTIVAALEGFKSLKIIEAKNE